MSARKIFDSVLTTGFKPSEPFLLSGDRATLDFVVVVDGATLAQVDWYAEFTSDDPNDGDTVFFREIAEQNLPGSGTTAMPKVVRTFQEADGSYLAAGTHAVDTQLTRTHDFCRIQIRCSVGSAEAQVYAVFGAPALSPPAST